jgi:hypothetical protein
MNKFTTALLLFFLFQLGTAQNKTVVTMKSQVMKMMEQISDNGSFTRGIFKENMVAIELLRKAADLPALRMSDTNKAVVKSIKRAAYNELLQEDHQTIIETATSFNINWKKVKFEDFLYKSKALFKLGQPGFEGLLIFKDKTQKDILFTLRVDFIMLGTDPYILEIDDLKKVLK